MKTSTQRIVALVLVVALFAAAIAGITQVVTADAQQRQTDDVSASAWTSAALGRPVAPESSHSIGRLTGC